MPPKKYHPEELWNDYLKRSKMPCSADANNFEDLVMHQLRIKLVIIFIFILPQINASRIATNIGKKNTFSILQNN